jgi:ribosome maturation factor RimP
MCAWERAKSPFFLYGGRDFMSDDRKSRKPGKDDRKPKPGKPRTGGKSPKVHGSVIVERVEKIVSGICEGEGIELVHVEFVSESHHFYLRVYIDKPGGVTMGDCAVVSRQLADLLDVHQIIEVEYRLEVSSPGIDRPLFKKSDYTKYAGRRVKVWTTEPVEGRKKVTGILKGISEKDCVELSVDDQTVEIGFSSIKKARLAENNGDDRC